MKKLLKYVLTFTTAAAITLGAGAVSAAALTYGNNSENILNGGVLASDGSKMYFANTEKGGMLYAGTDSSSKKLSSDSVENINVVGGYIYYTTNQGSGSAVYRMKKSGSGKKSLFTTSARIKEMYADSEGTIYYLTGGKVYERTADAKKGTVVAKSSISHFIPTAHGVIAVKGSKQKKYTIYADGVKIKSGVSSFYTVDNYLIFTIGTDDYQVKIRDMFENFQSSDIKAYTLGDDIDALQAFADALEDGDCEECEANAAGIHSVSAADDEVDAVKASSGITSALATASEGQKNMVKRARQQSEILWKPLKNITGWGGKYIFKAGTTYKGLPYGQPVNAAYVPWDASLDDFAKAVATKTSKMYTKKSTYNKTAPYYSCDCSSFVSWSWDCAGREWTRSIPGICKVVKSQSVYSCQIGDAFCLPGSHVVMVSDVGYDKDDEIVYIDIMEQTPPSTKYTRWGEGGSKSLSDLYAKYLKKGYKLYRYKNRDDVSFTASAAVPLDGETVSGDSSDTDSQDASYAKGAVVLSKTTLNLTPGTTEKLTYTTSLTSTPSWSSSNVKVATVSGGQVKAVAPGRTTITLKVGSASVNATVNVQPAKVKVKSITAAKEGAITLKWKKVTGADNYQVLRKDSKGNWDTVATTKKKSYTNTGLALNTSYTYAVRAGVTVDGSVIYGDYDHAGVTARTVLATPELTDITAASATAQTVSWKAVSGAEGYRLYSKSATKKKAKWTKVADTTSTSYTVKGLSTGSKVRYTVRAFFKVSGNAVLSNYDSKGIAAEVVPPTPEVKSIEAYADHVNLSWKKVSGATGYEVYRKKGSGSWKLVKTTTSTKFTDKKVKLKAKYKYTIRALKGESKSGYYKKGWSVKIAPGTAELAGVKSETANQAVVTWNKVAGADGYYIYEKVGDGSWTKVGEAGEKADSFTRKGLESGKTVTFTVRAYWKIKSKILQGSYNKAGVQVVVK